MGADKEEQLCGILFTLQLDVTTTPKHCSVDDLRFNAPTSEDMAEEFLFSKCLKTDTKGHTIFNALHGYLQEKSNYKYPDMRHWRGSLNSWQVRRRHRSS